MIAMIFGGLFLLLAIAAVRKVVACPLLRTLSISANSWAEAAQGPSHKRPFKVQPRRVVRPINRA